MRDCRPQEALPALLDQDIITQVESWKLFHVCRLVQPLGGPVKAPFLRLDDTSCSTEQGGAARAQGIGH